MLLAPKVVNDLVRVPLAFVDGVDGAIALRDPDTGNTLQVTIENHKKESFWIANTEYKLIGAAL